MGMSAIHIAAKHNCVDIVKMLYNYGANIKLQDYVLFFIVIICS